MIRRFVNVALLVLGMLVLVGAVAMRLNDVQLEPVLSGSMAPLAHPGDLAVTSRVPTSALAVGDVVAFVPPTESKVVMHRIVTLTNDNGQISITTKGDANSVADDWTAILRGSDARRLGFVVPLLGWLPQFRGLPLIVGGVLLLFVLLMELRRKEGTPLRSPA